MKQVSFLIIFLFSNLSIFAQENLNRTWFLTSLEVNGSEIEIPVNVFPEISLDVDGELHEGNGACNSFSGEVTASTDEITISSFTVTEMDCTNSEEQDFESAYFGFFTNEPPASISYNLTNNNFLIDARLTLENENGDTAQFSKTNFNPPEDLITESWFLDYFEENSIPQNYPAFQEQQYRAKIITTFEVPEFPEAPASHNFTCVDGGLTNYGEYTYFGARLIEFGSTTTLANFCSSELAFAYDTAYHSHIEEKNHTYEIIQEGQGRRLILTNENGDRTFYENAFLSTQEFVQNMSFSIYPNPIVEVLNLEFSYEIDIQAIQVYNLQGKLILKSDLSLSAIDVSGFSAGMYFIQVQSLQGTASQKFIKK